MTEQYQQNNVNVPRGSQLYDADANLTLDSDLVVATTVNGDVVLTLPRASQIPGQEIKVKADDAGTTGNQVRVTALAGENIDGASTVALTEDQQSICLKSDGSNWRLVCGGGNGETCCPPQLISVPGPTGNLSLPSGSASVTRDLTGCNLSTISTVTVVVDPNGVPGTIPSLNSFTVSPGTPGIADSVEFDFDTTGGADGSFALLIENECGCCAIVGGFVQAI